MILEVSDLSSGYGQSTVIEHVDLSLPVSSVLSVIGPNGSGKSTMLKAIIGTLPAKSGSVRLDGTDITSWSCARRVAAGLVLCPEGRQLFPTLSVAENLRAGAMLAGRRRSSTELDRVLTLFPVLGDRLKQAVGTMSGGEQQMVAIGRALMARPRVLLLDEPTLGLSVTVTAFLADTLRDLAEEGLAVVLVEQDPTLPSALGDSALICSEGRVDGPHTVLGAADASDSFLDDALAHAERRRKGAAS